MLRRIIFALALLAPMLCLSAGPASADKLVVFKNGKAMKVKSVTRDGNWLKCEFDDKNFLSVPASRVSSIEDAAAGSVAGDLKPNQMAAGSPGGGVAGGGFNPGQPGLSGGGHAPPEGPTDDEAAQVLAERQAAMAEEQAEVQKQGRPLAGANPLGSRRGSRFGAQRGTNPMPGLQPLTQPGSGLPNRNLSQRGIAARRGGVGSTTPAADPNQNADQEN